MEDSRLEKRKKFLDPVVDKRGDRAKFLVTLRKKKRQEIFKNKREQVMKDLEMDTKSEEFEQFEALVKEQIPWYDPEWTSFSDDFVLKFAEGDLMSVFKQYASYKSSHFAKFLTKLTYTTEINYLAYILLPDNKVIEFIEGLFDRTDGKLTKISTDNSNRSILSNPYSNTNINAIKDVLYLGNNIAATPEFRNELLKTSYMSKLNELVFYSEDQTMEIYELISWSIAVFTGNKIDSEGIQAFQNIKNVEIDLTGLSNEDKHMKVLEGIFKWIISIIHIQLSGNSKKIKIDSLKAIINLCTFHDIGDQMVSNIISYNHKIIDLHYFDHNFIKSIFHNILLNLNIIFFTFLVYSYVFAKKFQRH